MTLTKLKQIRMEIINGCETGKFYSSKNQLTPEQIFQGLPGRNKAVTVYSFQEGKFTDKINIFELFGHDTKDFTSDAVNNFDDSNLKLTHPEDVEHFRRYTHIVYQILTSIERPLGTLTDYYEISFRFRHAKGNYVQVRRSFYLYELTKDGKPKSHLDIWEVTKPGQSCIVKPLIITPYYDDIFHMFYEMNCDFLKIKFSRRQCQVLYFKARGITNKIVGKELCISSNSVKRHIEDMKIKVNDFLILKGIDVKVSGIDGLLKFARTWGLYPIPKAYLTNLINSSCG